MKRVRHITFIALSMLSLVLPAAVKAQTFDVTSVEAFITDHKRIRSLLLVRSVVEQSNELLHRECRDTDEDYRDVNLQLDKYNRCFDIIDLIYSSASVVFKAKNTYNDVKDRVNAYKELLNKYNEQCLKRGNILSSDTLLVTISVRTIAHVAEDGQDIIKSLYDLSLYATGTVPCTTADLMEIIDEIDDSLEDIRKTVDRAYFELWQYITVRTGYWTKQLYQSKTLQEISDEAIDRWLKNTRGLDY